MSDKTIKPLPERKEAFARREAEKGKGVASQGRPAQGSGPSNRHGLPQVPVGQRVVPHWPVLDLGVHPEISREAWSLVVDGFVAQPLQLSWADFMALPQVEEDSDFHCVTTWSRLDMRFGGVRFRDLMARAGVREEANHVLVTGYDQDPSSGEFYTTNLSLAEAMKPDVLLVHSWEGKPLPREHGGPCRMVTPQLYAWKGTKWISRITLLDREKLGFWERRGYSSSADPWQDDRYSGR
jgi:DMSO/TMAO reductase YedYZ molybdopterin-dependent catalytic subunit